MATMGSHPVIAVIILFIVFFAIFFLLIYGVLRYAERRRSSRIGAKSSVQAEATTTAAPFKTCPRCGTSMPGIASFCPECGAPQIPA